MDSQHGGTVWLLFLSMCLVRASTMNNSRTMSAEELQRDLLMHYEKDKLPIGQPTQVEISVYIQGFFYISEQTMDYSVSMYLRQKWYDTRLKFDPLIVDAHKIRLGEDAWNVIWMPDTFMRNEKSATYHKVPVHNRLMILSSDGGLLYATKISMTLSCPMDFHSYPMDVQICPMMFESFGYSMDQMYFVWMPSPMDVDMDLQLPQFTLSDVLREDCSQNYTSGAYSCLQARFVLRRDIGFFLIQVYVPSILVVILSWLSFWIDLEAAPARVSLGLLTVLTMTTQSNSARSSLPPVSYIKAIDIWMSTCLVFVFASLVEFTVVNVVSRKRSRSSKEPDLTGDKKDESTDINAEMGGKLSAKRIDKISRKMFPITFVLFNIIYWSVYAAPFSRRA